MELELESLMRVISHTPKEGDVNDGEGWVGRGKEKRLYFGVSKS